MSDDANLLPRTEGNLSPLQDGDIRYDSDFSSARMVTVKKCFLMDNDIYQIYIRYISDIYQITQKWVDFYFWC